MAISDWLVGWLLLLGRRPAISKVGLTNTPPPSGGSTILLRGKVRLTRILPVRER